MRKLLLLPILLFILMAFGPKKKMPHQVTVGILMDSIQTATDQKDFDAAIFPLRDLFRRDTILPDESTYYLGWVLYEQKRDRGSLRALLKYVELTGDSAAHFDHSIEMIYELSHRLYPTITHTCPVCRQLGPLDETVDCELCQGEGVTDKPCLTCRGHGELLCSHCKGNGVVVKSGQYLGQQYALCTHCQGDGAIDCPNCDEDHNHLGTCHKCAGTGQYPKQRVCTHGPYAE